MNNKSIMILGRNNNDVNLILDDKFKLQEDGKIIFQENKNIKLYFLTVHKSKGLEEENVIIINDIVIEIYLFNFSINHLKSKVQKRIISITY